MLGALLTNVVSHICEDPTCKTVACFGYENEVICFCNNHKLNNMINLTSSKCQEEGCTIGASFGYPDGSQEHSSCSRATAQLFCATHMKDGMVNVEAPICKYSGCNVVASYVKLYTARKTHCVLRRN